MRQHSVFFSGPLGGGISLCRTSLCHTCVFIVWYLWHPYCTLCHPITLQLSDPVSWPYSTPKICQATSSDFVLVCMVSPTQSLPLLSALSLHSSCVSPMQLCRHLDVSVSPSNPSVPASLAKYLTLL